MSDQKQLRFQMVVDQASVQQFGNAIQGMIRQLDQLTKSIAAASQAMGGLLGGGNVGAAKNPSATVAQAGYGSGIPAIQGAGVQGTGSAASGKSLSDIFLKNSSAFKGMADASKQSMKVMTDGLAAAVRESKANLDRLDRDLERVASSYDRVAKSARNFSGTKLELQSQAAGIMSERGTAAQSHQKLMEMSGGGGGPGGGGGGFSMGGVFAAAGTAGMYAAIAMSVAKAVEAGLAFNKSSRSVSLDTAVGRADAVGGTMMSSYGGDFRHALAMQKLTPAERALLRTQSSNTLVNRASNASGVLTTAAKSILHNVLTGNVDGGAAMDAANLSGHVGGILGLASLPGTLAMSQAGTNPQTVTNSNMMEDTLGTLNKKIRAKPLDYEMAQSILGNAQGRVAIAGRLGGYKYDPKTGRPISSGVDNVEAAAIAQGFSGGDMVGSMNAIAGIGGERAGHNYKMSALLAQRAGIGNAAQLYGMGAQGGGAFTSAIFGAMGNGMDRNAAAAVGGGIYDRMAGQGNGMYDASGLMAIAQGSGLFSGGGGDMLAARQFMGGMQGISRTMGGGLDAFGMTHNALAAKAAMGGGGNPYGRDYLTNGLTSERALSIYKGASLNPMEEAMGITAGNVKSMVNAQGMQSLSRFRKYGDSPMEKFMAQWQASGKSGGDFVKSSGIKGKDAASNYAAFLNQSEGLSMDDALGKASIMFNLDTKSTSNLKRRMGIGGVDKNSPEGKALASLSEKAAKLGDFALKEFEDLGAGAKNLMGFVDTLNKAVTDTGTSAAKLEESLESLFTYIDKSLGARGVKVSHKEVQQQAGATPGTTEQAGKKQERK